MKATKVISILTAALVFLLAIGAFSLSYNALRGMAADNGITGWQSYIWPLLIDFALIVFSLAVVRASLQGEGTVYGWALVGLYTAATITFNVLHAPGNLTARVIAAVAPVSLFLSFELLMGQLKTEVKRHNLTTTLTDLAQQIDLAQNNLAKTEKQIVSKEGRLAELKAQIQEAANGQFAGRKQFIPGDMTALAKANQTRQAKIAARRETVLTLLEANLSNQEIADKLNVSLSTIKNDRKALNGRVTA